MFGWLKKNKSKKKPIEDESQELSPREKPPTPQEAFNKWKETCLDYTTFNDFTVSHINYDY